MAAAIQVTDSPGERHGGYRHFLLSVNAAFEMSARRADLGQPLLMPDGSTVINARRRMWRRILVMYGVAVAFGVIVSAHVGRGRRPRYRSICSGYLAHVVVRALQDSASHS
jgi:hypothetical protein